MYKWLPTVKYLLRIQGNRNLFLYHNFEILDLQYLLHFCPYPHSYIPHRGEPLVHREGLIQVGEALCKLVPGLLGQKVHLKNEFKLVRYVIWNWNKQYKYLVQDTIRINPGDFSFNLCSSFWNHKMWNKNNTLLIKLDQERRVWF